MHQHFDFDVFVFFIINLIIRSHRQYSNKFYIFGILNRYIKKFNKERKFINVKFNILKIMVLLFIFILYL